MLILIASHHKKKECRLLFIRTEDPNILKVFSYINVKTLHKKCRKLEFCLSNTHASHPIKRIVKKLPTLIYHI